MTLFMENDRRAFRTVAGGEQAPVQQALGRLGAQAPEVLRAALAALDEDRLTVLVLYDVEGVAMSAISAQLAIPPSTGYARLHSARAALKAAVEQAAPEGPPPFAPAPPAATERATSITRTP
jgi:DNA-directed RNA polymerase specialized sigma24 family protein